MTKDVETYFLDGCGRCELGGTPDCKARQWQKELDALRGIILKSGLSETCKWGVPCYTFQGKNILLLSALKDCCTVSFFKGSLLQDGEGLLVFAGENSFVAKMLRFTGLDEILNLENAILAYIFEAIELEKTGAKVQKGGAPELPEELLRKFEESPALKTAFGSLTPGRQRGWILHFSQPKLPQTRAARIEKSVQKIMSGMGVHD